jgi:2-polyprenyl-6-methoxyphenol hydroxylase-like FAD-dependent oxidoreductase
LNYKLSDESCPAMEEEVEVLVVGAGPAGLTAAITLARYGVRCLLVERRSTPPSLPRATVTSLRTMELLRAWGLTDEVLAGSVDVEWRLWVCHTLAEAAAGEAFEVGIPSKVESALLSPTAPGCVPQDHLEQVLLDHLRTMPGARVDSGVELVALHNRSCGVRATVRNRVTNRGRVVHARYVIAADGVHGPARASLGIEQHGVDHLYEGVSVLFRGPVWDVVGEHRYGIYWATHQDATATLLPAGGDRWIYSFDWDPQREQLADYTSERLARLIRLAVGAPNLEPQIERVGAVTFGAFMAERFREKSAFLVGDAAHRITPRGGTGMNLAIADGYDLGWKLAWVLRGWAQESLLDTYEAERRPAVEHNLERSIDPGGSRRPATDEVHVDLGGRIPHVWLPGDVARTSTLDLVGPGLTLFTVPDTAWERAAAAVGTTAPFEVRTLDRFTARALGIRGRGALLVRPDGVRAGAWLDDDHAFDALRTATVRARCRSRSMPMFASSEPAMPVSPQHVA